mmetsp:Transcript_96148/g.229014  ORF Transcript_96148/g.229014 Transcript_96148/m.229014 type:complete len:251 (+) Transcript_96148:689-1441(+)
MTSTKTPRSMYIMVTDTKAIKNTISGHSPGLPAVIELITSALAPNTAGRSSVLMDSGTELKKEVPIAEPSVNCRKRMAKAYVMIAHSNEKTQTERAAKARPFTMIMSSGNDRRRRVSRVSRTSLAKRIRRSSPVFSGKAAEPPAKSSSVGVIQVSTMMRSAKNKSKLNQKFLNALILRWKAMKRMMISTVKYKQKKFSPTMNTGCAFQRSASLFRSASTPSQMEFRMTIIIVRLSKKGCLAILCAQPSSL